MEEVFGETGVAQTVDGFRGLWPQGPLGGLRPDSGARAPEPAQ